MRTTCQLSSQPLLPRLLARTGVWLGLWRQPLTGAWPRGGRTAARPLRVGHVPLLHGLALVVLSSGRARRWQAIPVPKEKTMSEPMPSPMPELPMVTASCERLLVALRRCHQELAARVDALDEEDLTRQSYCTEWSVAQVLSHLGSGAEIALAQLDAARAGTAPLGTDDFRAVWARWDARPPRQQAAAFTVAVPRLHDTLDALDDAERCRLRPWFHTGHVALPVFLAFRLVEQALHAWDVHVAFEPTTPVDAQAVGLLVELLPLGASLADPQVLGALAPARLAIQTSDPARRFVLDLGEQARLGPAEGGEVSGSLRLPAEALVRLFTGRLDPAHTPPSTVTEGRPSLDELRQLYPAGR
jgi:uncharacterized protein (TIGR03083 family)